MNRKAYIAKVFSNFKLAEDKKISRIDKLFKRNVSGEDKARSYSFTKDGNRIWSF